MTGSFSMIRLFPLFLNANQLTPTPLGPSWPTSILKHINHYRQHLEMLPLAASTRVSQRNETAPSITLYLSLPPRGYRNYQRRLLLISIRGTPLPLHPLQELTNSNTKHHKENHLLEPLNIRSVAFTLAPCQASLLRFGSPRWVLVHPKQAHRPEAQAEREAPAPGQRWGTLLQRQQRNQPDSPRKWYHTISRSAN